MSTAWLTSVSLTKRQRVAPVVAPPAQGPP